MKNVHVSEDKYTIDKNAQMDVWIYYDKNKVVMER